MTYSGVLFTSCCALRWDMVGIARGTGPGNLGIWLSGRNINAIVIVIDAIARQLWFIGHCLRRWQAIKRQQVTGYVVYCVQNTVSGIIPSLASVFAYMYL